MRFEDAPALTRTWLARPRPKPDAPIKLICLHHAGGNPSNFRPWLADLPENMELFAVRLAGREARLREPPATRIGPVVEALAEALSPLIAAHRVVVFGHSLGSLLAFETMRELRRTQRPLPHALVVSGRRAPGTGRALSLHQLPDREFIKEVQRVYGGIPQQLLAEPELLALTLPALRGDLSINETYEFSEQPALDVPLRALGGTDDPHVLASELQAWGRQTSASFSWAQHEGDHFYLGSPAGRRWVIAQVAAASR
ncbi:thioesterase [Pseudenhygromyxa sp. WMMC2535]|uniref:thioesterase n=1 Tax=Pseudenhygromyxa sp. WMMC2535 TaxID=2712867 RepID=UPI0015565BD4|nr:thioesterase [Pseudenhygromyxa sp. WMMC2535]